MPATDPGVLTELVALVHVSDDAREGRAGGGAAAWVS